MSHETVACPGGGKNGEHCACETRCCYCLRTPGAAEAEPDRDGTRFDVEAEQRARQTVTRDLVRLKRNPTDRHPYLTIRVQDDGRLTVIDANDAPADMVALARAIVDYHNGSTPRHIPYAEERLQLAREALTGRYFTAAEVDDDIAPRIIEMHSALTLRIEKLSAELERERAEHAKLITHLKSGPLTPLPDYGPTDAERVAAAQRADALHAAARLMASVHLEGVGEPIRDLEQVTVNIADRWADWIASGSYDWVATDKVVPRRHFAALLQHHDHLAAVARKLVDLTDAAPDMTTKLAVAAIKRLREVLAANPDTYLEP